MSNTPRTDAALVWARPVDKSDTAPPNEQFVDSDFARKLERENNRLRKEHRAMSKGAQTNAEVIKLQAKQINALREDNARLREAAEIGLGYAINEYMVGHLPYYPPPYDDDKSNIAKIKTALGKETNNE